MRDVEPSTPLPPFVDILRAHSLVERTIQPITAWHRQVAEYVWHCGRTAVVLPSPHEAGIALPGLSWSGPLH